MSFMAGVDGVKKETAKVSIIMGIYNCAETLEVCINSILNQTYPNWELIMCDDGSKDNTYHVAESYANLHSNIILIKNKKNLGLAAALNKCLKNATGKYIARQDSDDISLPERLEKEVDFLDRNPQYAVVGTGRIIFDENGEWGIRIVKPRPQPKDLVFGPPFAHPTIMMRKEVYDRVDGYRISKHTTRTEDYDLWFRVYSAGYIGYNLQDILYKYREGREDYKKRKFKHKLDAAIVCYYGIKSLKLPKRYLLYVAKHLIAGLIPNSILRRYHTAGI